MFNYKKLKTSALIMFGGILITTIPVMSSSLIEVINDGAVFDWRTPATLAIGAFSTWVVATIRNFIKGK